MQIPVAKSGHVGHLIVGHGEQLVPVLVLHLHDVEHALHTLLHAPVNHLDVGCEKAILVTRSSMTKTGSMTKL